MNEVAMPEDPVFGIDDTERMIWKAKCRQCGFVAEQLKTGNAVEDVARAHSVIHGHDIEISFSIIDCLCDVIRANDPRD